MQYLKSFNIATAEDELDFVLGRQSYQLDMACYSQNNAYPFHIFSHKGLYKIDLAPITIFYGDNGSGKSTLLNIIAEKTKIKRSAPFNDAPVMKKYLDYCSYETFLPNDDLPESSEIITSDGVFDYLLDVRAINKGIKQKREDIFDEYESTLSDCTQNGWQLNDLSQYDELKRRNEVRRKTKSQYTSKRVTSYELPNKSNGESAFLYFTQRIKENSLYLLDEPENSLSAKLQVELADFLENSVRFYGCQLIISTHSPFLLSLRNSIIYDLDSTPITRKKWNELDNVIAYYNLFKDRQDEFN